MNRTITVRNTFSILFFMHRGKTNKNGEHPVYCRVTVQGKSREFSTQIWVYNDKWQPKAAKITGTNEAARTANYSLSTIRGNLLNIRADLQSNGRLVTSEVVVNIHLGKSEKKYTLLEIHEYYNEQHVKKLIGKDYAVGTYTRYKTSLDHIVRFLNYKYRTKDLVLHDLTYSFATEYEFYLKTVRNCAHNTSLKYIKNLKAVINCIGPL